MSPDGFMVMAVAAAGGSVVIMAVAVRVGARIRSREGLAREVCECSCSYLQAKKQSQRWKLGALHHLQRLEC